MALNLVAGGTMNGAQVFEELNTKAFDKTGDTVSGDIDMDGYALIGLPYPSSLASPIRKNYAETQIRNDLKKFIFSGSPWMTASYDSYVGYTGINMGTTQSIMRGVIRWERQRGIG